MKTRLKILSILYSLLICSPAYAQIGILTETPKKTLHVNGSIQVTREVNVGGTASTEGSAGTSGQVLTSKGTNAPPEWQSIETLKGSIANSIYVQGTAPQVINSGTTMDVPGVTTTITVPAGRTQTVLFMILGYALRPTIVTGASSQGVFTLLQNNVKISSAYASSNSAPNNFANGGLNNLPAPVTFFKAVTLAAGTYTFRVQYAAWSANQIVNFVPSTFVGYNGDTEAMLTKMQVFVFN